MPLNRALCEAAAATTRSRFGMLLHSIGVGRSLML